jgi:hypothetical protein
MEEAAWSWLTENFPQLTPWFVALLVLNSLPMVARVLSGIFAFSAMMLGKIEKRWAAMMGRRCYRIGKFFNSLIVSERFLEARFERRKGNERKKERENHD